MPVSDHGDNIDVSGNDSDHNEQIEDEEYEGIPYIVSIMIHLSILLILSTYQRAFIMMGKAYRLAPHSLGFSRHRRQAKSDV